MLRSLCIAFSTYSILPMPHIAWEEKAMRRAICFFPLIGAVIGGAEMLWLLLCEYFALPEILRGAIAAVLPLILTGGIHMDGFCDTVDALASHQSRERKLEILKDSHTGAFAIIFCGVYLLCYFAAWSAVSCRAAIAASIAFVLSRALSALALTNWQCARKNGMLRAFSDTAEKKAVNFSVCLYLVLGIAALFLLGVFYAAVTAAVLALTLLIYRIVSKKQFGGVTGDLAGWFLQLSELAVVLALCITEKIFL